MLLYMIWVSSQSVLILS
ncbi:Uncharacterized protein HZ326_2353, partial [Fusarium oxysporum f. sp. albedinis]